MTVSMMHDACTDHAVMAFMRACVRAHCAQRVGAQELAKLADDGKLKSVIKDNVFHGLEAAPEAFAKLESGRATGKVVVTI